MLPGGRGRAPAGPGRGRPVRQMITLPLHEARPLEKSAVAVGSFDGVHLGHQAVLRALGARAREAGAPAVLLTFRQHPRLVARREAVPLITTAAEQEEVLARAGIDRKLVIEREETFALSPAEFISAVLGRHLGARWVVVGFNFRFGRGRRGDERLLRALGPPAGFALEVVAPIRLDGEIVSSTLIRRLLAAGAVERARAALGRCYQVRGMVVRGAGRGTGLGFPTANVRPELEPLVRFGIYRVTVSDPDPGARLVPGTAAVAFYGTRPTFDDDRRPWLEVHVPGFSGDLLGRRLHVFFTGWLRAEERFPDRAALVRRMREDVASLAGSRGRETGGEPV